MLSQLKLDWVKHLIIVFGWANLILISQVIIIEKYPTGILTTASTNKVIKIIFVKLVLGFVVRHPWVFRAGLCSNCRLALVPSVLHWLTRWNLFHPHITFIQQLSVSVKWSAPWLTSEFNQSIIGSANPHRMPVWKPFILRTDTRGILVLGKNNLKMLNNKCEADYDYSFIIM